MSRTFLALAPAGVPPQPAQVLVPGASRAVAVPLAAGRCCRFTFEELCQAALSAADYLALCAEFDAFVLDNVPAGTQAQGHAFTSLVLILLLLVRMDSCACAAAAT